MICGGERQRPGLARARVVVGDGADRGGAMAHPLHAVDDARERAWAEMVAVLRQSGLLDGIGSLADAVYTRVFVLDGYRSVANEDVRAGWRSNLSATVSRAVERRHPGPLDDDSALRRVGRERAQQGIGISEVVRTAAIQNQVFIELASTLAPASPYRDALVLELMSWLQSWSSWGIRALVLGHREAELSLNRRANERRTDFVQRLLTHRLPASEVLQRCEEHGLDPGARYLALRARPQTTADLRTLERSLRLGADGARARGLVAMVEGDLYGFATAVDGVEPGVAVGVSTEATLGELHTVFRLATRAHDCAVALGLTGVVALPDLGLRAAVVSDHAVTEVLLARYVTPFLGMGDGGAAILETVERYLAHQSSPGQTAKELFVHTNTVRYRLARFEATTGCSLHDAQALVEVWWALAARRLVDPDNR
jgi:hypothetical protein